MTERMLALGKPNRKQREFLLARELFIAYGGARGGGKSWAVRMKAIAGAVRYPGIRILICRHTYPELEATILEPMLATLRQGQGEIGTYKAENRTLRFGNGSMIRFGHFSGVNAGEYQGQEYDWVFLDEATQFTEWEFRVLAATLRGVTDIPRRMYLTCNPGGVGHSWVKRLFIDRDFRPGEKPEDYRFIPATVEDNEVLMKKTPGYLEMLDLLPEEMRRGHRYGDWNAMSGQFFPEFRRERHVYQGDGPKEGWKLYRAMDYGLDMLACVWVGVDATFSEHVGIVTGGDRRWVTTVEGNSGKTVKEKRYDKTSKVILGYVSWEEEENMTEAETKAMIAEAVKAEEKKWQAALEEMKQAAKVRYQTAEEVPQWGREAVEKFLADGTLKGGDGGLELSEEMLRLLVILARREEKQHDGGEGV